MQSSIGAEHTGLAVEHSPIGDKPTLHLGYQGMEVLELQKLLAHWNVAVEAQYSLFDKSVEQAVKAFQRKMFLEEDGIVDTLTWQALYTGIPVNMPILRKGSTGHVVKLLQQVLKATGDYRATIDGQFGVSTEASVKRFQKRYGLVIDGIVGTCTWHSLSKVNR
jgi:peptidoglycan hydrolase-like protein with peptidoglycan-binding domain